MQTIRKPADGCCSALRASGSADGKSRKSSFCACQRQEKHLNSRLSCRPSPEKKCCGEENDEGRRLSASGSRLSRPIGGSRVAEGGRHVTMLPFAPDVRSRLPGA